MPLVKSNFKPSLVLRNGHLNTILTSLIRTPPKLNYKRERIETPDDDFFDVDFCQNGHEKVAILCHGLEGNSNSSYIQGIASLLSKKGFDIAAMNYRFCSGEINKQLKSYHAGDTRDINLIIELIESKYKEIYLVGFSLGSNLILKYLGDGKYKLNPKIKAVAAVSALVDLEGASLELSKTKNIVYSKNFILTLAKKMKLKHEQYPDEVPIKDLKKVKRVIDFDDYFTSVINGFKDAKDYYAQSNSLQFLKNIQTPTLIINALDDPFASKSCIPKKEAEESEYLYLMTPKYGGHVGFYDFNKKYLWSEKKIAAFFNDYE
jgi:hypothetical protein